MVRLEIRTQGGGVDIMAVEITCKRCGKLLVVISKGKVNRELVAYCARCAADVAPEKYSDGSPEMPEFLKGLFP